MEYFRTSNSKKERFQWTDSELCMILDTVTGEPERAFHGNTIGKLSEAIDFLAEYKKGWEDRTVIVKLSCIQGLKIDV